MKDEGRRMNELLLPTHFIDFIMPLSPLLQMGLSRKLGDCFRFRVDLKLSVDVLHLEGDRACADSRRAAARPNTKITELLVAWVGTARRSTTLATISPRRAA